MKLTNVAGSLLIMSLIMIQQARAENACQELFSQADGFPGAREKVSEAAESLSLLSRLESQHPDQDGLIYGERRELSEFLKANSENLAEIAPLTVLNAAQRMLALILSQGTKTVTLPVTGERVPLYPFFSGGGDITNGKFIIGNETAIKEYVSSVKSQARGDRSGSSIPLLVGSHGTGKSEFLSTLSAGSENLTRQPNSKFGLYTYQWHGLEKIPSLLPFLMPTIVDGGKKVYAPLPAPLGDSPFTLFPKEVQNLILQQAGQAASALIGGEAPHPIRSPDPISQFIRAEIIRYYSAERGHGLSAKEIVEVLGQHTSVVRIIMSKSSGKMPLIDVQADDLDVAGLFMTPNPIVRIASGVGPSHVMAWYLNGKIPTGHGNVVQFEEFFRNPKTLRDMLLSAFESRVLNIGGAPSVPLDALMVATSNTVNLEEVRSDGKGAAAADRFKIIPMRWSTDPHEVAQVLMLGKMSELQEQSLISEDPHAPIEKAKMSDLFPRRESLAQFATPDRRYRLISGTGTDKVEIAPHTILLMAEIVAASRMHIDANAASKLFSGKIATAPLYRDPIHRLAVFEGLSSDVTPSELAELHKLSLLTKEGETGISARDAGKWFSEALDEAAKVENGHVLTPKIVLQVYRKMLNTASIQWGSQKERMTWEALGQEVPQRLLLPRLEGDISSSLANGNRVVTAAYFEMIEEFMAIEIDPQARTYISTTSRQERAIDKDRLAKVNAIYKNKTGRDLNVNKIAIFHAQQNMLGNAGRDPDRALFDAVAEYYAQLNTQVAGLRAIAEFARTGEGGEEVRATYNTLIASMKRLGYNERAAIDALVFVQSARMQRGNE